jgi:MFS family permease
VTRSGEPGDRTLPAAAGSAGSSALGPVRASGPEGSPAPEPSGLGVLANRRFLSLWLAQASTQIGGNMVIYGLTIIVYGLTSSNSAVSLLILTFLAPAVVFSAVAGVYVDRIDRRLILISTNLLRGSAFLAMVLVSHQLLLVYVLNILVSTATTLFAPAEAAMIPVLVERNQLMQATGLFNFTMNASFAIGFALLGPLVVNLAGGPALLLLVAVLYFVAAALCVTLPGTRPDLEAPEPALGDAERAVASMVAQLREGLAYIHSNPRIFWSLAYLAVTASLIGVLGVLGPGFATKALGLREQDFVVVILPLGGGIVTGILLLNRYGRYLPRRRAIEGGLLVLSLSLVVMSVAGPLSRFLQESAKHQPVASLNGLVSLLSIVISLAFVAGAAYAFVAIPAQTQLQEELPEEVRGRVFGVLNMLVSISSFLPIVVVGPVADMVGTPVVLVAAALMVGAVGVGSILVVSAERPAAAVPAPHAAPVDPVAVTTGVSPLDDASRRGRHAALPTGRDLPGPGDRS